MRFSSAETWTGPDGVTREMVRGRCERCHSVVLAEPSQKAVEMTRVRLTAMRDAMRTAARQETQPAVSADEGVMAD